MLLTRGPTSYGHSKSCYIASYSYKREIPSEAKGSRATRISSKKSNSSPAPRQREGRRAIALQDLRSSSEE